MPPHRSQERQGLYQAFRLEQRAANRKLRHSSSFRFRKHKCLCPGEHHLLPNLHDNVPKRGRHAIADNAATGLVRAVTRVKKAKFLQISKFTRDKIFSMKYGAYSLYTIILY